MPPALCRNTELPQHITTSATGFKIFEAFTQVGYTQSTHHPESGYMGIVVTGPQCVAADAQPLQLGSAQTRFLARPLCALVQPGTTTAVFWGSLCQPHRRLWPHTVQTPKSFSLRLATQVPWPVGARQLYTGGPEEACS